MMRKNTQENREKLAAEAVDQMDLKDMMSTLAEQFEVYYGTLVQKEFNEAWNQVFGED